MVPKLYEISLIMHFKENSDLDNTNKKTACHCLSTQMAEGEEIFLLSFLTSLKHWDLLVVMKIGYSLVLALERS